MKTTPLAALAVTLLVGAPAFAGGAVTSEDAEATLRVADSQRTAATYDMKNVNRWDRYDNASERIDTCVKSLDTFFKQNPKLVTTTTKLDGKTASYESVKKACNDMRPLIEKGRQAALAEKRPELQKQLNEVAIANFPDGNAALAEAAKDIKAKNFSDAYGDYQTVVDRFHPVVSVFSRLLKDDPALASVVIPVGKNAKDALPAQKVLETAQQMEKSAETEKLAVKEKAAKQEEAAEAALQKALKGDRKKLVNDRGMPSWYTGANYVGLKERNNAALTATSWRYDSSSGCSVTFSFKGSKQTKVTRSPAGCSE